MEATFQGLGFAGFPKIRGPILGTPIIRNVVFWGLYWGPPILRNFKNFRKVLG